MSINSNLCREQLIRLYEEQSALHASPYLRAHSATRGAILRQVEAAELYLPHVHGRVLDWGCMHAADACIIRMHRGLDVELHGCDFFEPGEFSAFHSFAQLCYKQLEHPYQLPYPDNFFDTIIADGVLEHVPIDAESLKELYRILKPDGLIVFSCLPNRFSYTEYLARLFRLPHHLRTYTMRSFREKLLHSGFEPTFSRHLQMVPTLSGVGSLAVPPWLQRLSSLLWNFNTLLESVWPFNRLSSNLFVEARKRAAITWSPRQVG
jgi:SAM-dependent methyltransferase